MSEQNKTADMENEDTRALERARIVKWMRSELADKKDPAAQKAFMAKVNSTASYHGITLEELLQKED